jgi:hypothetical protein
MEAASQAARGTAGTVELGRAALVRRRRGRLLAEVCELARRAGVDLRRSREPYTFPRRPEPDTPLIRTGRP